MPQTFYITARKAQKIYNAVDYAEYKGERLSHFIVINLDIDVTQNDHNQFRTIRNYHTAWRRSWIRRLRAIGAPEFGSNYVYSLENPRGDNLHVNWMVYVPNLLRINFQHNLEQWIQATVNNFDNARTFSCSLINPEAYKSTANYMLKGLHPDDAAKYYISNICAPQGLINGQRAGFSNNLGPSAIRGDDGFDATEYRQARRRRYRKLFAA